MTCRMTWTFSAKFRADLINIYRVTSCDNKAGPPRSTWASVLVMSDCWIFVALLCGRSLKRCSTSALCRISPRPQQAAGCLSLFQ